MSRTQHHHQEALSVASGLGFTLWATASDVCAPPQEGCAVGVGGEAPPAAGPCPPACTTGGKTRERAIWERQRWEQPGLHWLRVTFPAAQLGQVQRWCDGALGDESQELLNGMGWYRRGREYRGGVRLAWEQRGDGDTIVLEVPGAFLELLDLEEQRALCWELHEMGAKCTRVDVKADLVGDQVTLVHHTWAACKRGELTCAKRWAPRVEFDSRGSVRRHELTMGARGGNGSGRYVRVYDKGLERGEAPDERHRFEVEFTSDAAHQVFATASAVGRGQGVQAFERVLWERLLGAVSFTIGDRARSIRERTIAPWWSQLCGLVETVRTVARRVARSVADAPTQLLNRARWLSQSAFQHLRAIASEMGGTTDDAMELVERIAGVRAEDQVRRFRRARLSPSVVAVGRMQW